MSRPAVLTVADTIAKSFVRAAEVRGDRPAIREKKFGIWQPTSWREWLQISKEIAYGLRAIGVMPGCDLPDCSQPKVHAHVSSAHPHALLLRWLSTWSLPPVVPRQLLVLAMRGGP